jgi:uncharacterized membrane protein
MGYGHVYAPAHYVDAWVAVTDVRHWSSAELVRLKRHLANAAGMAHDGAAGNGNSYDDRGG